MNRLVLILLLGLSWLDAAHLPPRKKDRPKPIEPDKPNNDFRVIIEDPWKPDAEGFYWVKAADGRLYGDKNKDIVIPFGKPISR